MLLVTISMAFGQEKTRPRVFMTPEMVQAARTRGALTAEQNLLRGALLRRAEESLSAPLSYIEPGHPDLLLSQYRVWPTDRDSEMLLIRRDARDTDALALAYAITGERKYADKAWENVRVMLSTYKAFGSFHPHRENNDLAAAHAFMALAMTWDLCSDAAPEKTRRLVLTEGVRRARFMYNTAVSDWRINGLPVPFETPGVPGTKEPYNRNIFAMLTTNHCWVDVALLGCLALALEDENISAAGPGSGPGDWLRFAIHFFDYITGIMPPDGSWPESRVYGAPYAFEGSMPFLMALKRTKGIDFFSKTRFFHNFAYGRLYAVWNHPGHGGIANFGEGGNHEWHSAAWIYAVASGYRDPVLQWSANCWTRYKPAFDEPAWQYLAYDPTLPEQRPDSAGLPKAILLGDMSHIHVRGGTDPWGENDRVLSFRGSIEGKNQYELQARGQLPYVQTWHMHQSRNAVLLAVNGRPLVSKAKEYKDSTRYYSVLEVNGQNQESPGKALPGVTDFDATDVYVTFSNEIGDAYPGLESYRRRVVCLEPDLYVIADHARAAGPVQMNFRLHFGARTDTEFHPATKYSLPRVTGSHEGIPFSCEIISTEEISANLEKPTGENPCKTLRYGPPGQSTEFSAMAVVRLGSVKGRVLPVMGDQPNLMGAFIAGGKQPLAVIVVEDRNIHAGPPAARYIVPRTVSSARHLVTGLIGSRFYSVQAMPAQDNLEVTVSFGDDFAASPQGALLFDIVPSGKAVHVHASPLPDAQDVAAEISKGVH